MAHKLQHQQQRVCDTHMHEQQAHRPIGCTRTGNCKCALEAPTTM